MTACVDRVSEVEVDIIGAVDAGRVGIALDVSMAKSKLACEWCGCGELGIEEEETRVTDSRDCS